MVGLLGLHDLKGLELGLEDVFLDLPLALFFFLFELELLLGQLSLD